MAREAKGWTRRQLAVTAEVTPAAVSQYENGTYQPTRGVIARIAIALGMPREFFVPGRPTAAASSSVVHFRSLRSTPVRDRRRALTHAVFAWELTNLLESYLSIPPVAFPRAVLPERASRDDMENLAGECRRLLNLGSAPIGNMTRHLESLGAVVVRLPVGCEKVDAFSCVLEDRPIVVLNSDKGDKARSRHDAAHEFGHLVAHDDTEPGKPDRRAASPRLRVCLPPTSRPGSPISGITARLEHAVQTKTALGGFSTVADRASKTPGHHIRTQLPAGVHQAQHSQER